LRFCGGAGARRGGGARTWGHRAGGGPAAARSHRPPLQVRVRAAAADAARLDDLAGPLTAVTDRGQSVALKSDGISLEGDGGLLFAETEELDRRARVLKKVSGTLRAFPHAEKLRLELEGREGAE